MPQSVYIHIPFCKNKCNYCSFVSYTNYDENWQRKYIETLIKEIQYFYKNEPLKTLYFGGGTPSLIKPCDIQEIIKCFNITKDTEITIEINPETIDKRYLQELWDTGVNRLSIGIQTFNDNILKRIGRIHTAQKAIDIIKTAQNLNYKNISVDLIYGLPNQTLEGFIADLNKAIELNIQHVSLYGLKIEEGCKFFEQQPQNIADDDMQADMYIAAIKILEKNEFKHYEISNFSKEGYESKHNLNYWNSQEYYGFGAAAHGYDEEQRYSNHTRIEDYLNKYKEKEYKQTLTKQDQLEEAIFLGLRRAQGINIQEINKKFGINFNERYKGILFKYLNSKHLIETQNGYKFSTEGFLVSNNILADFL